MNDEEPLSAVEVARAVIDDGEAQEAIGRCWRNYAKAMKEYRALDKSPKLRSLEYQRDVAFSIMIGCIGALVITTVLVGGLVLLVEEFAG